jgi:hypothetical protein
MRDEGLTAKSKSSMAAQRENGLKSKRPEALEENWQPERSGVLASASDIPTPDAPFPASGLKLR